MKAALLFTVCLGLLLSLVSAAAVNRDMASIDRVADQLRMLLGNMTEMVKLTDDSGPNDLKTHLATEELIKEVIENLSVENIESEDGSQMVSTNAEEEDTKVSSDRTRLHCRWHGLGATCCAHTKFGWFQTKVCITIHVIHPHHLRFIFTVNGRVVYRTVLYAHHTGRGCAKYHGKKFCLYVYNLQVRRSYVHLCMRVYLYEHGRHRHYRLGCIRRRFDEIETEETGPFFKLLKTKDQEDPENGELSLFKETDEEILKF